MTAAAGELAGLLAGCGAAAVALLARDPQIRHRAMAATLLIAPVIVAADVWDEPRVVDFRHSEAALAAALVAGVAAIVACAAAFRRWPQLFPILAFALLPLRVPVDIGGENANLLIPLYLVIAAAVLATARTVPGGGVARQTPSPSGAPVWLRGALAATLVLYAVQTAYSEDVSNAIENAGFFLIPFAVLFALLAEVPWSRRLLGRVLVAVGAVAVATAAVGVFQYASRDLFLNPDLEASNQIHLYFRANSIFFDPNIYGRYLALALVGLGAYMAWGRAPRLIGLGSIAAAICLVGLAFSFSITSFAALLAGLLTVAILRWRLRGAVAVAALGLAALAAFALAGGTPSSDLRGGRDIDSGRTDLLSGGLELAEDRPLAGWGAGSFGAAFYERIERAETTVSHAEPVTVLAEQGAIGLALYAALVATALATLFGAGIGVSAARSAVAACFVAMIVHSLGYAGFATDPATWALLAVAVALRPQVASEAGNRRQGAGTAAPAPV